LNGVFLFTRIKATLMARSFDTWPLLLAEKPNQPSLRARRERPRGSASAKQTDELAAFIKKTRSHGTIAKGAGLAKRPRSAKDLPFSCSRVGAVPVGNSLDHLVGAQQKGFGDRQSKCFRRLEGDHHAPEAPAGPWGRPEMF
jgi:hypothetical protein